MAVVEPAGTKKLQASALSITKVVSLKPSLILAAALRVSFTVRSSAGVYPNNSAMEFVSRLTLFSAVPMFIGSSVRTKS